MGKPINKRNFGENSGTDISVTANVSGTVGNGFIIKQSGTRKYLVNVDGDIGMVWLVDKDAEDLLEGEAVIQAVVGENTFNVSKLTQHRATVWGLNGLTSYSWKNDDAQIITIEEAAEEPEPELSISYEWVEGTEEASGQSGFSVTLYSDEVEVEASDINWIYDITLYPNAEAETETNTGETTGSSPSFVLFFTDPVYTSIPPSGTYSATWNGQTVSFTFPE